MPARKLPSVAADGDRRATLVALRDRLAADIEACESKRDMAALSQRLMDVLEQLDNLPADEKVSPVDEIAKRRADRRGRSQGQARAARGS